MMRFTAEAVRALGLDHAGYSPARQARLCSKTKGAYFVSVFGHSPETFVNLFEDLYNFDEACDQLGKKPALSELLMTANWLKEGITFNSLGGRYGMNPETVSKKCWAYTYAIEKLYGVKVSLLVCCLE
jgi:hypothetical protein